MEINNNQQDKIRINRQICSCSFLDLVIFKLRAAIFTQNQIILKSWSLYYQFTQSYKFLLDSNKNSLKSYSDKCVFHDFENLTQLMTSISSQQWRKNLEFISVHSYQSNPYAFLWVTWYCK